MAGKLLRFLKKLYSRSAPADGNFSFWVREITGQRPLNLNLYELAFRHSSASREENGERLNNERLEFLGDAVLSTIVAEYLYHRYPSKSEGYLTTMRSKVVSRKNLNQVGRALGVWEMITHNNRGHEQARSLSGDALEALIGALYLDRGMARCRKFVIKQILEKNTDLRDLQNSIVSYKGALLEWGAQNRQNPQFSLVSSAGQKHDRRYQMTVQVSGQHFKGKPAPNKKKAEENAAQVAYNALVLKHGTPRGSNG